MLLILGEKKGFYGSSKECEFTYLTHPDSVLCFSWRNSIEKNQNNVLFSLAADSFLRLWKEQRNTGVISFRLIASVDLVKLPKTILWLEFDIIRLMINRENAKESKIGPLNFFPSKSKSVSRLASMTEYDDAIMQIEHDGSFVVWGLNNLAHDHLLNVSKLCDIKNAMTAEMVSSFGLISKAYPKIYPSYEFGNCF